MVKGLRTYPFITNGTLDLNTNSSECHMQPPHPPSPPPHPQRKTNKKTKQKTPQKTIKQNKQTNKKQSRAAINAEYFIVDTKCNKMIMLTCLQHNPVIYNGKLQMCSAMYTIYSHS